MNTLFIAAAALTVVTGLAHTVIGEILIFQRLRRGTLVPGFGGEVLRVRHVHILWASWHALTLLAWSVAGMLIVLAAAPAGDLTLAITRLIAAGMVAGALVVLVATRARHPGWLAMALVAVLVEWGR